MQPTRQPYNINCIVREERPREKFLVKGPEYLDSRDIFAIIIGSGHRKSSVMETAGELARKFNPVSTLLTATVKDLTAFPGIGRVKALEILAAVELARRIQSSPLENGRQFLSARDIAGHFNPKLRGLTQEQFHVILLDNRNRVIESQNTVTRGTLTASLCHPREIFKAAIARSACSIFCVHNHPSGDPSPSTQDIEITRRLFKAGEIVGIQLLDHIIIGDMDYYSMREHGYV